MLDVGGSQSGPGAKEGEEDFSGAFAEVETVQDAVGEAGGASGDGQVGVVEGGALAVLNVLQEAGVDDEVGEELEGSDKSFEALVALAAIVSEVVILVDDVADAHPVPDDGGVVGTFFLPVALLGDRRCKLVVGVEIEQLDSHLLTLEPGVQLGTDHEIDGADVVLHTDEGAEVPEVLPALVGGVVSLLVDGCIGDGVVGPVGVPVARCRTASVLGPELVSFDLGRTACKRVDVLLDFFLGLFDFRLDVGLRLVGLGARFGLVGPRGVDLRYILLDIFGDGGELLVVGQGKVTLDGVGGFLVGLFDGLADSRGVGLLERREMPLTNLVEGLVSLGEAFAMGLESDAIGQDVLLFFLGECIGRALGLLGVRDGLELADVGILSLLEGQSGLDE